MRPNSDLPRAAGGVTPLADLVQYQSGSIVSTVLAKTGGGNVTLFAFAAGEGLSEHTVPFDALVYVVDGSAEVGIAADRHQAAAGDLVRLPAGLPHWIKAVTPFKMLLIMLREVEG